MSKGLRADANQSIESTDDTDSVRSDDVSSEDLSETQAITSEAVFDLLSNRRRRYTLHCLEQEGTVELGDLARRVAAWETGKDVDAISASERKNVYTSLQQFHLPKLDEKGIVEFDDRKGTVEPGPATDEFDIYMEVVEQGSVPWSHYYLALSLVHALAIVSAYAGLVPGAVVASFCVTTLAVSALAHAYYTKTEMQIGTSETPPQRET